MSLPPQEFVEKTVHGVEPHWLSSKETFPGAVVSKKVSQSSGTGKEPTQMISLKNGATVSKGSNSQLFRQNSPSLFKVPRE